MKQKARLPELDQETRPELELIEAPPIFQRRTELQRTAQHLYRLGWNVFPVPRPHEVRAWAIATGQPEKAESKPPYILQPLFRSRMELSGEFYDLFEGANLAVMAGKTSGNLCIIDADQNGDRVQSELDKQSIDYWDYKTARGHNFILRIAEGEAMNLPAGRATIPGVEVWGYNHFCVLPPSVHSTGEIYQWGRTNPLKKQHGPEPTPISELEFLGVQLRAYALARPELYGLPEWTAMLAPKNRETLASVIEENYRNTSLTGPVYDLAAHVRMGDIEENQALELLYQAAGRCEPPYPEKELLSMWRSAIKKRNLRPSLSADSWKHKTNAIYKQALEFAHDYTWTGRTAQTDRAVFLACAERARIEGQVFYASCRHIAELANCRTETASKALKRLQTKEPPLIELQSADRDRIEPNRYKFADLEKIKGVLKRYTNKVKIYSVPIKHTDSEPLQDVFGRLGRVALRCYLHLLRYPEPTITAIAKATQQNRSSVSRAINGQKAKLDENGEIERPFKPGLIGYGLVIKSRTEGVYMAEPASEEYLQELAKVLGTAGRSEKRKAQHTQARQIRVNKRLLSARRYWRDRIRGAE